MKAMVKIKDNAVLFNDKIIQVIPEDYPENPREWDNLTKMVFFHKRYTLGDKHNYKSPDDFLKTLQLIKNKIIIAPVYFYNHSGFALNILPFADSWDSGRIGWIYIKKSVLKKEFGITKETEMQKKAEEIFKAELEEYEQYINGEVYLLIIRDKNTGDIEFSNTYWGCDFRKNGMMEDLMDYMEVDEKTATEILDEF